MSRRTIRRLSMALSMALAGICPAPLAGSESEDELKSAIVLSFLRYSTWPAASASDNVLRIGVLGRPSLAQSWRALMDGKTANNHAIRIVEMNSAADPCQCQVIYIAADKRADIRQALAAARASHALTIGETDRFLEQGGMVNLLVLDGHMSFEVSLETLEECGITISSKLLRLGQIKKRRPV